MRRKLNKKKKKQQIGISVDTLSYFSLSLSLTRAYTQSSAIVSRKMEVRVRKKAINNKKNSARQVDFKIFPLKS